MDLERPGWMHETSARVWCTGKTQRDRVEREVGGGIRMGNTCKSMANSYQCTHWGTFRLLLPLAIADSTVVSTVLQTSFQDPAFNYFGKYLEVGLLDYMRQFYC